MVFGTTVPCCAVSVFGVTVPWAVPSRLSAIGSIPAQTTTRRPSVNWRCLPLLRRPCCFIEDFMERGRLLLRKLDRYQRRSQHKQDQNTTSPVTQGKYQRIVKHFPAMRNQPEIPYPIHQQRTHEP